MSTSADHVASFPSSVWTGTSSNRSDANTEVAPYSGDYTKISAEVIAIENYINSKTAAKVSLVSAFSGTAVPGTLVYVKSDGTFTKAINTSLAVAGPVGILMESVALAGTALVQFYGIVTLTTAQIDSAQGTTGGYTLGGLYYVGASAGLITTTAPVGSTTVANIVGIAVSATQLVLCQGAPVLIAHA